MQGYFNGLDESEMLATRVDLILLKQTPPGVVYLQINENPKSLTMMRMQNKAN